MNIHTSPEQRIRQRERRIKLLEECANGVTKMDILSNKSFPLHGESEAMYFKLSRDFLKTSLARRIMDINQDIYMGE